jgi:hypothetical protein
MLGVWCSRHGLTEGRGSVQTRVCWPAFPVQCHSCTLKSTVMQYSGRDRCACFLVMNLKTTLRNKFLTSSYWIFISWKIYKVFLCVCSVEMNSHCVCCPGWPQIPELNQSSFLSLLSTGLHAHTTMPGSEIFFKESGLPSTPCYKK